MAPKDFHESLGAMGPPPRVLQPWGAPIRPRPLDSLPDTPLRLPAQLSMNKDDTGKSEPQGQEVVGFGGGTKGHRMNLMFLDILEAKDTSMLLRMGLQVLITSRTAGDESYNKFSGITRDHRRIMETFIILEAEFQSRIRQPFDIIEAKYTRVVVARTLYLKLLTV